MEIDVIVVCDKYGDFLKHTLPATKHLFGERVTVVTSHEDEETLDVCIDNDVACLSTKIGFGPNGRFAKGKAINHAIRQIGPRKWVLQLDADIYIPRSCCDFFQNAQLDPSMIYGIDRIDVRGLSRWSSSYHLNIYPFVGFSSSPLPRIARPEYGGYVPIGFFQLWHTRQAAHYSGFKYFEEDVGFAMKWPRAKRALIPEVVSYHLASEDAKYMMNWNGRKSARFE